MAMSDQMGRDRDLVLAPGEFAFVLDTTKGLVNTVVGPNKISMSNTDQPVVWDRSKRRFERCDIDHAIQTNPVAPEGFYIALYNPADNPPRDGASSVSVALKVGHRVNIPGPTHFPLWPGQIAEVIRGHHLRSNQYLLAQVYNDAEANANWQQAVVKPQGDEATTAIPRAFAPGQLIIIRGTEVAFFMPPTGIKVVPEKPGVYVRDAVTLERLEYCILLDEDGNKRYVQGPEVVFPEPTETFITKDNTRKFNAIELNETTGLYIKVIADYVEADGTAHKAGDELFITGKEQAIYFQREEHSIIRYGNQTKHYAVAIPPGEGRYVLDRITGEVRLIRGPKMLLCDPRREVIVRRILDERNVRLWYPGNDKAVKVNQELESHEKEHDVAAAYEAGRLGTVANYLSSTDMETRGVRASRQIAGDMFTRGSNFTPPRTITLDTKYEGAVAISVWSGYAILVANKTGQRRVVLGPETVLLEYDESLTPLELSTGVPKTDTKLLSTVYLCVRNNKISDEFLVETEDLVRVKVRVSYRVHFEGDEPEKWFAVENYVRLLCDHMRSLVRNSAKRKGIADFYGNAIDLIRDATLGVAVEGKRSGRMFAENNMHVYDIEVLDVQINDPAVASMLSQVQERSLHSALSLQEEERKLEYLKRSETIKRESVLEVAQTRTKQREIEAAETAAQLQMVLDRTKKELEIEEQKQKEAKKVEEARAAVNDLILQQRTAAAEQEAAQKDRLIDLELKRIVGETKEIVERAKAVDPSLATALTAFSDQQLIEKISIALGPMASMSGVSAADILAQLFKGTPFEGVMKTLGTRSRMPAATV